MTLSPSHLEPVGPFAFADAVRRVAADSLKRERERLRGIMDANSRGDSQEVARIAAAMLQEVGDQ